MKIQIRYRTMVLAALAISLLAIAGFPQTAFAGTSNNGRAEIAAERRAENNGQQNKSGGQASSTNDPATNPPTSDGPTTHDGATGPGGQTCDGDPSGRSDTGSGANAGSGDYQNTCATSDQDNSAANGQGDGNAAGKPCAGCVGNADDKNPPGQYANGNDHNNGYECDPKGGGPNNGNSGVGVGNPAHTGCSTNPDQPCVPSTANHHCNTDCVPSTANHNCGSDCNPSTDANQCKPCPGGKDMLPNGKCTPDTCPDGSNMPAGGCQCPSGGEMPANGTCDAPCVPANGNVCDQATPSCVAAAAADRCGGGTTSVLGETLARPEPEASVLGVSLTRAAPSGLARTGYELLPTVRLAMLLAIVGLGMVTLTRRRRMIDIASRLGG
ncbi:MAG TPA: hypothetical protein VM143_08585 [Acidimicrobiales bacterium]|nr:hypothetical protein [Acidimicrobiales bacterium]